MVDRGAGEILLTSMDRDGTKAGYDLALTRAIADAVRVPVIASGGVGTLDHLVEGIRDGHADAVLAASIFHFGTYTIARGQGAYGRGRLADAAGLTRPVTARRRHDRIFAFRSRKDRRRARPAPAMPNPGRPSSLPRGIDKAAKKLGEEAVETVIAAVKGDREDLVSESADLLYHLAGRSGDRRRSACRTCSRSLNAAPASPGIAEKASRPKS